MTNSSSHWPYLIFSGDDPYDNLAAESYLFNADKNKANLLLFYRNRSSVVIGRSQNPWKECNLRIMDREGVLLVRRQTGGGTVYHDSGNLNFSFITNYRPGIKKENISFIKKGLLKLGVDTDISDRHDLLLEGKKISGSAFRISRGRILHHGTLLVSSDLRRLHRVLDSPENLLAWKGVESIRSEVTQLSAVDPAIDCDTVIGALTSLCGPAGPGDSRFSVPIPAIRDISKQYRSTEWLFGKTPPFSVKLQPSDPGIHNELVVSIDKGRIKELTTASDTADSGFLRRLNQALSGVLYRKTDIESALLSSEFYKSAGREYRRFLDSIITAVF